MKTKKRLWLSMATMVVILLIILLSIQYFYQTGFFKKMSIRHIYTDTIEIKEAGKYQIILTPKQ